MCAARKPPREPDSEWRRRATAWGLLPVSRVRIPLQLSGGAGFALPGGDPIGGAVEEPLEAEAALATGEVERALPPTAADPVQLYLTEIGRAKLLTAAQEVEIGRRIEAGQTDLRRVLAAVPVAVGMLLGLADRVREHELPLDELILFAEGGEAAPRQVKAVLAAFARIRRLARAIGTLERARRDRRLSAAARAASGRRIEQKRQLVSRSCRSFRSSRPRSTASWSSWST